MLREPKLLYIQGCARSGNTLMRELCVAGFKGTRPFRRHGAIEVPLEKFLEGGEKRRFFSSAWVASRDRQTSLEMKKETVAASPHLFIIWMLRNPLDILTSIHPEKPGEFYVSYERLAKSVELYERFKDHPRVLTVRYEDLVRDPDKVQSEIAGRFLFEAKTPFTLCHKRFGRAKQTVRALKGARRISGDSLDKWRKNKWAWDYLTGLFRRYAGLPAYIKRLGYEAPEEMILASLTPADDKKNRQAG